MRGIAIIAVIALALGSFGCTTTQKRISGAAVGGASGAAIGGPIGAGVGAVAGAVVTPRVVR
jgi:osmotically inducible lipoprotein OsmB